jgi:hypothetical protein
MLFGLFVHIQRLFSRAEEFPREAVILSEALFSGVEGPAFQRLTLDKKP